MGRLAENRFLIYQKLIDDHNKTKINYNLFLKGQIVFKLYIFSVSIRILSTVLIILLLGNTFAFAEDKDVLIFNDDYFADSLTINQSNKDEFATSAFAEDKYLFGFNGEYFVDLLSLNQVNQDGSATISSTDSLSSQSQNVNLRSAHKYLGYATALLAGITAATSSSKDFHEIAGYTTAGLSLITTAIGFYEYGEYLDLDEGFTGYNVHMILETAATIGFIAAAALKDEKSTHATIGGVSTALIILPIFVVHW